MTAPETKLRSLADLRRWAEKVYPLELVIEDPDEAKIDRLYPAAIKIGEPFEMKTGPMKGNGRCIRRKLAARQRVLTTILYSDGTIKEWELVD